MSSVPPILIEELEEEDFSEAFLEHYLETDDLSAVKYVEIEVDAQVQTVEALGSHLPNLELLRLTGSQIHCIRDLGSQLRNLRVLWITRAGLADLDGISILDSLQELYVAFNHLTDISPLMYHDLEVLDLEGNCLPSLEDVGDTLVTCSCLKTLNIQNNPCVKGGLSHLRKILPKLEILDDDDHDNDVESTSCSTNYNDLLDADLDEQELIVAAVKKSRIMGNSHSARPSTAHGIQSQPRRMVTAPAAGRPRTSWLRSVDENTPSSSSLTSGTPVAGNPLQAIRQNRSNRERETSTETIEEMLERFKAIPVISREEGIDHDRNEERQLEDARRGKDIRPATPDVRVHVVKRITPSRHDGAITPSRHDGAEVLLLE